MSRTYGFDYTKVPRHDLPVPDQADKAKAELAESQEHRAWNVRYGHAHAQTERLYKDKQASRAWETSAQAARDRSRTLPIGAVPAPQEPVQPVPEEDVQGPAELALQALVKAAREMTAAGKQLVLLPREPLEALLKAGVRGAVAGTRLVLMPKEVRALIRRRRFARA